SPARAGSVSGRLLGPSGEAIAGARVQWVVHRDEDQTLADETRGVDPWLLGETKTDPEGRFRVTLDKPDVAVSLRLLAGGFPSVRVTGPFDSTGDVNLYDIQAPAAGRAAGLVVDESGNPISGARVVVSGSELLISHETAMVSETRTGADGSFSMIDTPAGGRSISIRAPGFVRATRVQITPRGDERVVLARGGTIQGVVRDGSGDPVPGAIVSAGDVAAVADA